MAKIVFQANQTENQDYVTGLIATVHWLAGYAHNAIGGIHGKLGFLFLIIAVTHCFRYRKFYMNKSKKHA